MAITVIGFFRNKSEAAEAVTQLTESGIYRNDIDVSTGRFPLSESSTETDRHEKSGNAITRFFNSIFGDDSDDAKRYTAASQVAESIVTVHAGSREQAEEAANILDASGALDIDEGDLVSDTTVKSKNLYPYATERVSTDTQPTDGDFRNETRTTPVISEEISYTDIDEPTSVGLTDNDLAEAGLSSEEIKSIQELSGGNLANRARTRSRIVEKKIEEELRLREEHDRLHREG